MDKPLSNTQKRKNRRKRYIGYAAIPVVVSAVAICAILFSGRSIKLSELTFATVKTGPLVTTISSSGRVVPAHEQIVNSPVSSTLLRVLVHSGDTVIAGTPLLELDLSASETDYQKLIDRQAVNNHRLYQTQLDNRTRISNLEMQITVKEMTINRLRIELENEKRLDSLGSGTGDRVRQAATALRTAELELAQLNTQLTNERENSKASEEMQRLEINSFNRDVALMEKTLRQGKVPAPIDGVVTFISSETGSSISAGQKVAVIADLTNFKIESEISEGDLPKVSVGADATVRIGNTTLEGMVSHINPQSQGGMVKISIILSRPSHQRLQSGLKTAVEVSHGYKNNVILLTNGQYFKGPGTYELFVMEGKDRLVKRKVRLGDSNRNFVEVISGLEPGMRVVVSDMDRYKHNNELNLEIN